MNDNGEDKTDSELKRLSLNRSSIAERRRLYESRSESCKEEKPPQSPLPLYELPMKIDEDHN